MKPYWKKSPELKPGDFLVMNCLFRLISERCKCFICKTSRSNMSKMSHNKTTAKNQGVYPYSSPRWIAPVNHHFMVFLEAPPEVSGEFSEKIDPLKKYPTWLCQQFAMENGHRNSEFSHWTWWFSIVMLNYRRVNHNKFYNFRIGFNHF